MCSGVSAGEGCHDHHGIDQEAANSCMMLRIGLAVLTTLTIGLPHVYPPHRPTCLSIFMTVEIVVDIVYYIKQYNTMEILQWKSSTSILLGKIW